MVNPNPNIKPIYSEIVRLLPPNFLFDNSSSNLLNLGDEHSDRPVLTAVSRRCRVQPFIVCIGSTDWRGINHRPQHMLRGLAARGWSVLYVNAPITWLSPLKNSALLGKWEIQFRVDEIEPGIRILEPPVVAPLGSMWSAANLWNQHRLARAINGELERLGVESYVLYSLLPSAADLLPLLSGKFKVLYDCVDDHAAFSGLVSKRFVRKLEERLAERSDVVLATASKLVERLQTYRADPKLVPNGVHVTHFTPTRATLGRGAMWRRSLGADVVAGFVGGIGDWIDLDLIAELARLRPRYTFVMIGPALTSVERLQETPNIRLLGPMPYSELPPVVQSFDVGLSPFVLNELTESVNPVKIYEYLAAGIDVVATPMRELQTLRDVVHLARTAQEFAEHIDGIIQGANCTPLETREAIARDNSWDKRIEDVDRMLREIIQ